MISDLLHLLLTMYLVIYVDALLMLTGLVYDMLYYDINMDSVADDRKIAEILLIKTINMLSSLN